MLEHTGRVGAPMRPPVRMRNTREFNHSSRGARASICAHQGAPGGCPKPPLIDLAWLVWLGPHRAAVRSFARPAARARLVIKTQSIPPARVGTHVGRKSCMSTGAYAHHVRPRDTRGPEAAGDCARKEAGPRAGATSSDEAQWSQFKLCLPFVRCDGMA